ncbi:MAG: hypothetical protein H7Z40_14890 [Phycisphaerae bacterium]|nr:hypothetical protein [Gemmatimonadaceae bacterium]
MMRARGGTTLVELIVALPIGALIGTIAVAMLLDTHKLSRRLSSSTQISRELRQAAAVLASEIRPLAANDVVAWTDTSIEVNALVGSGIVCATSGTSSVDMLPLHGTDPLRTSWFAIPQGGDQVFLQGADSSIAPQDAGWFVSSLHSATTSATSGCTTGPHMAHSTATGNPVRLTMNSSLAVTPATGSLVRIARRARYSLYRASDGLWYLGRKSFGGAAWTTIQPVAGPFDRPQLDGLLLQVRDSANNVMISAAAGTPRSVALELRGTSAWKRSATVPGAQDSVLMHVTLRGQMEAIVR